VELHRTATLGSIDIETVAGLQVTSIPRTIVDLARMLTPHHLCNVMHRAGYRDRLSIADVVAAAGRSKRSSRVLARALELHLAGSSGTRSFSEDRVLAQLVLVFMEPLVNTVVETIDGPLEVDFRWEPAKVIFELDPPHHLRLASVAADTRKTALLQAAGYQVFRCDLRGLATTMWELRAPLYQLLR
jgi:hypothetical protein